MIKTTNLAKKIWFHEIIDDKFKINKISVYFINKMDPKFASLNAMLALILKKQCKAFPSTTALNRQLKFLYGAELDSNCIKFGDIQIINFSISILADRFSLKNEPLLDQATNLLCNIIFEPNFKNEMFDENDVKIEKQNLTELIESELSDKQKFAALKAMQLLFENQNCGYFKFGTTDDVKNINPKTLTAAYFKLLQTSDIHIIANGQTDFENVKLKMTTFTQQIDRSNLIQFENQQFMVPANFKVKRQKQFDTISQSKLVMSFASNKTITSNMHPAIKVMIALFGGTPTSKLFSIVREELNYCYYCKAQFSLSKKNIWVFSGVESKNLELAEEAIKNQLTEIQKGNFSQQEVDQSKNWIISSFQALSDDIDQTENFHMIQFLNNSNASTTDEIKAIEAVSTNDIVNAANLFSHVLTFDLIDIQSKQP